MNEELKALKKEMEEIMPIFELSEKFFPDGKTGEEYEIKMKVRQIGKREDMGRPSRVMFEVLEVDKEEDEDLDRLAQTPGISVEQKSGSDKVFVNKVI